MLIYSLFVRLRQNSAWLGEVCQGRVNTVEPLQTESNALVTGFTAILLVVQGLWDGGPAICNYTISSRGTRLTRSRVKIIIFTHRSRWTRTESELWNCGTDGILDCFFSG